MKEAQTSKPTGVIARRTGLDRRWIASGKHHPERRRCRDRRAIRKRSFLEPLELNASEEPRVPSAEVDSNPGKPEAKHPEFSLGGQWSPRRPPSMPKKVTSDDG